MTKLVLSSPGAQFRSALALDPPVTRIVWATLPGPQSGTDNITQSPHGYRTNLS